MIVKIDTEKDFDKIKNIIMELPEKQRDIICNELKVIKKEQFTEAHDRISMQFKEHSITEDDISEEINKIRKAKSDESGN